MRDAARWALVVVLLGLAWLAWQPPAPAPAPPPLIRNLPHASQAIAPAGIRPDAAIQVPEEAWRVVTRRLVWKKAVDTLRARLTEAGLDPIPIRRREEVTLHAFDDATLFSTREAAERAARDWRRHHIEASVIQAQVEVGKPVWLVGLGRFYLTEYAEQMQHRLRTIGKPYRYERREVRIPTWRFTFAPRPKQAAEALWRKLQDLGVATPVLMPEEEFEREYGAALSPRPDRR